jgi:hypothetical protein
MVDKRTAVAVWNSEHCMVTTESNKGGTCERICRRNTTAARRNMSRMVVIENTASGAMVRSCFG